MLCVNGVSTCLENSELLWNITSVGNCHIKSFSKNCLLLMLYLGQSQYLIDFTS